MNNKTTKIEFTGLSAQKYDLITNGIRKSLNQFLDDLSKHKIEVTDLKSLDPKRNLIYSKEIEQKVHIIIGKFENNRWVVLDIVPSEEFKGIFKG